jgi:hypothetical protein
MKRSNPQSPPTKSKNTLVLEHHVRQGRSKEDVGADREKAERAKVVAYLELVEFAYES